MCVGLLLLKRMCNCGRGVVFPINDRCSLYQMSQLPNLLGDAPSSVYGVHRGGGGQLTPQSQSILGNLARNIGPKRKDILAALGWGSRMHLSRLLARLTGLSKGCVGGRLGRLAARGYRPEAVLNAGGRKRKSAALDGKAKGLPNLLLIAQDVNVDDAHPDESWPGCGGSAAPGDMELDFEDSGEASSSKCPAVPDDHAALLAQQQGLALDVCPYKGLREVDPQVRDWVVGARLAGLAVRVCTSGLLGCRWSTFYIVVCQFSVVL
jgi:hypothetical protein